MKSQTIFLTLMLLCAPSVQASGVTELDLRAGYCLRHHILQEHHLKSSIKESGGTEWHTNELAKIRVSKRRLFLYLKTRLGDNFISKIYNAGLSAESDLNHRQHCMGCLNIPPTGTDLKSAMEEAERCIDRCERQHGNLAERIAQCQNMTWLPL
jgi:hypothetical protein